MRDLIDRILKAETWWMVRGEKGTLWEPLFHRLGVVAHGSQVPKFDIALGLDERERAMANLDSYGKREVNEFIEPMDEGHAVVTPDEGSGACWFGIITSECFADLTQKYWMMRRCDWYPHLVPTPDSRSFLRKTPMGTVFNVTSESKALRESLLKALA